MIHIDEAMPSREVPVMVGLRLFLPETWTGDQARLERAGVPAEYRSARAKSEIALAELDRLIAAGVGFGTVLADAGVKSQRKSTVSSPSARWRVSIGARFVVMATKAFTSPFAASTRSLGLRRAQATFVRRFLPRERRQPCPSQEPWPQIH